MASFKLLNNEWKIWKFTEIIGDACCMSHVKFLVDYFMSLEFFKKINEKYFLIKKKRIFLNDKVVRFEQVFKILQN